MNFDEMESSPASFTEIRDLSDSDPFSPTTIETILATTPDNPNYLLRGETNKIELKESFGMGSLAKYARTMAAFANTQGGYIIFGVVDASREIVGLSNEVFDSLDPERLTRDFNSLFLPTISFRKHLTYLNSKKIGLLYTYPSIVKPVMAKREHNTPEIKEGEIFFRYEGRTERIKYPELRAIIDDQRRRETELWLKYMSQIARIGVENAAILDSTSGVITGSGERTVLLDEGQIAKLNFIHEGRIHDTEGAPTLKLLENAQEIPSGLVRTERIVEQVEVAIETEVEIALRTNDIIVAFLTQKPISKPKLYIEQVCFSESGNLPVYYFAKQANLSLADVVEIVQATQPTISKPRQVLLSRLMGSREHKFSVGRPSNTSPMAKRQFYQGILDKTVTSEIKKDEIVSFLNTVQCLIPSEVDIPYLFPLILELYKAHYRDTSIRHRTTAFRSALCHLDCILFQDDVRPFES